MPRFTKTLLLVCLLASLLAGQILRSQEKSVRPGINDSFQNPDVTQFVERFEREGREIYDRRDEIVAAAGVTQGMVVADIGAGTGLFTRLFAERVGSAGHVYAVDIAPNFIEHIEQMSTKLGLDNVSGIVCAQDDVCLPPASIDLAFICDTYHHFEFPEKTMRSLFQAMRPGGRVVLIDFRRIEGVSSNWVLEHVRAGQETFAKEIEAEGFQLTREKRLLHDNYFLVFQKPAPQKEEAQEASVWMKRKLEYSQNILDGLTHADFDKIVDNANAMHVLAKVESFVRGATPEYRTQLHVFQLANENLRRHGENKNLDGATLAFSQLVISCVDCHELLRKD